MTQALPTHLFAKHQLVTDPVELLTFEVDAGFDRGKPDVVFYAESRADVSRLLQWAHSARVPIVARGAGTGLSGGAVPARGGIIVGFARMNRLVEMDTIGRSAVVEPGLVNLTLDSAAKAVGLYYPPDPSSGRSAVIGGNIGENSGGPHCFKYGVTTNYVTGLEVVLADGQVIGVGGRALDYPEYDLCGLLVGNEGTLGLVTRCAVRLINSPPAVKTMMVSFRSDEAAGEAVSAIIAAGLVPAALEMMDRKVMGMIEAYVQVGLPVDAEAALIVEVDGYAASLDSQVEEIAAILVTHHGYDLRIAQGEEERQRIWYGRKSAAGAFARLAPAFYLVDVTVPRSFLAATLREITQVLDRHQLQTGHVFHAGDGNLHPCILCDPKDEAMMARVLQACAEIVAICVAKDGSITGEHGVGIEKRAYMAMMYNGAELAALRDVKDVFDPLNLLNPGKVLPDELPSVERVAPALPVAAVFAPATSQEAAAGLAALAAERTPVHIGAVADVRGDLVPVVTSNLGGVLRFAPDDLYVAVGAGMPLKELQEILGKANMRTPLATPWSRATVGGLAAANVNAPLRMKYGGWRDNVLSTTVALADGRVIRAGRPVVKNVAGYDIPKLFVGSFGTLGLLCEVTLKLAPLPRLQRTLCVEVDDPVSGLAWAQATSVHWLTAAGVVLVHDTGMPLMPAAPWLLAITLEGLAEDVEAEQVAVTGVLRRVGAPPPTVIDRQSATDVWCEFVRSADAAPCLVRIGIPPRHLRIYWSMVLAPARAGATWCCDVANGLFYAALAPAEGDTVLPWLDHVRQPALALGGYAVVMAVPGAPGPALDRWGYRPDGIDLMRRIKARWDPAGILNPGAFVL